jgi:hypothetical protein
MTPQRSRLADPNVLAAVRVVRGELFVVIWERGQFKEACRALGRWAGNPELAFDWRDAGLLIEVAEKLERNQL